MGLRYNLYACKLTGGPSRSECVGGGRVIRRRNVSQQRVHDVTQFRVTHIRSIVIGLVADVIVLCAAFYRN